MSFCNLENEMAKKKGIQVKNSVKKLISKRKKEKNKNAVKKATSMRTAQFAVGCKNRYTPFSFKILKSNK